MKWKEKSLWELTKHISFFGFNFIDKEKNKKEKQTTYNILLKNRRINDKLKRIKWKIELSKYFIQQNGTTIAHQMHAVPILFDKANAQKKILVENFQSKLCKHNVIVMTFKIKTKQKQKNGKTWMRKEKKSSKKKIFN